MSLFLGRFSCIHAARIWSSRIALQRFYQNTLELLSNTETAARDLQVCWANRHWAIEIAQIFLQLRNEETLQHLGLYSVSGDECDEINRFAKMFGEIIVRTASQRCWTMASWSEVPPLNWFSVLSQDEDEVKDGLKRIRGDQESVDAAWHAFKTEGHPELEARTISYVWFLLDSALLGNT